MSDPDAAPERAYLDHMPLSQMDSMCCAISALCRAGHDLAAIGFDVRFDLTGLNGAALSIDWRLPLTRSVWQAAAPGVLFTNSDPTPAAADPVAEAEKAPAGRASGGGQEASDPAAAHEPEPAPEPEQSALVAEAEGAGDGGAEVAASDPAVAPEDPEKLGGDRGGLQRLDPAENDPVQAMDTEADPAGPSVAEARPEVLPEMSLASAIGAAMADAAPLMPASPAPQSPPPGSASALAALTIWTDAEDARLIQITVGAMIMGAPKAAAIRAAAEELGRPFNGAQSRLYSRLKPAFEVALREAEARKNHAADPIAEPAAPSSPAAGASDGGAVSSPAPVAPLDPAPLPRADLSPIEAHLFALPAKGGWTMERDFTLLTLAEEGWKPGEIAEDMGLDARQVQDRWDRLSGLDPETKARRWTRADLIAALKGWTGKGGK